MVPGGECLFCRIARREEPASILYEDAGVIAFLDPFPAAEGHLLVIPREHYEAAHELPEELAAGLFRLTVRLARRLKAQLQLDGLYLLQASEPGGRQRIRHFHLHLIPRHEGDRLEYVPPRTRLSQPERDRLVGLLRLS